MTAQLSLGVEKHGRVDRKKFLLHEKDEYLWAAIVLAACNSLIFSLDITGMLRNQLSEMIAYQGLEQFCWCNWT